MVPQNFVTAITIALSIGEDEVVIIDIYIVYGMGLPLVKWGLSLSVPIYKGRNRVCVGPYLAIYGGRDLAVWPKS